jgi:hypothetical protein
MFRFNQQSALGSSPFISSNIILTLLCAVLMDGPMIFQYFPSHHPASKLTLLTLHHIIAFKRSQKLLNNRSAASIEASQVRH